MQVLTVLFSNAANGRILFRRSAEAKAEPEPEADSSQYGSPVNSFNAPIAAVGAEYTVSHSPPAFEYHGPEAAESSNVPVVAAVPDSYASASAQVSSYSAPSSSVSLGAPFTPSAQASYGSSNVQQPSYGNQQQEQCSVERTLTPTGGDCQQGGQVRHKSVCKIVQ